jgi:fatty-acyl-CoA synthase
MIGYWDEPEESSKVKDADGWTHSGALATLDEEGYCNIVGPIKDMVIRGGENLHPREIEEHLYRHPKIQDVQVFGVPDERYGEEICARLILRAGDTTSDNEFREFCRGAHQKVPRYIRVVDNFPLSDRKNSEVRDARRNDQRS